MATKSKKSTPSALDFDQYMNEEYGKPGTKKRAAAEKKLKAQLLKGTNLFPKSKFV